MFVPAFGFLVPSSQKEPILGVIFDTCSFPQVGDITTFSFSGPGKLTAPLSAFCNVLSTTFRFPSQCGISWELHQLGTSRQVGGVKSVDVSGNTSHWFILTPHFRFVALLLDMKEPTRYFLTKCRLRLI